MSADSLWPAGWPGAMRRLRTWLIAREYTLLPYARLRALEMAVSEINRGEVSGAIVQCGVYKGGSAAILATTQAMFSGTRTLWLFDSFQGLPAAGPEDGSYAQEKSGAVAATVQHLSEVMRRVGADQYHINTVPGWFESTFETADTGPVALLHLDADLYSSTLLALRRFYTHLEPGGYLIIDDYGSRWEGCRKAVDEFFSKSQIAPSLIRVDNDCYLHIKPGLAPPDRLKQI